MENVLRSFELALFKLVNGPNSIDLTRRKTYKWIQFAHITVK